MRRPCRRSRHLRKHSERWHGHRTPGTLIIEQLDDKLVASLAHLSSVVEAFTEPETARVELVPGSGEVLRFVFSTGEQADAVKWGDETFQRK